MNPVLAYAIEHQAKARNLLAGYYRIPFDDVADVAQDIVVRILRVHPSDPELSKPWKARAYWTRTLQSAVSVYWRRSKRTPPQADSHEDAEASSRAAESVADPHAGLEASVCATESIREAWAIARPAQRRAIIDIVSNPGKLNNRTKVNICRLRRRLRERAAV